MRKRTDNNSNLARRQYKIPVRRTRIAKRRVVATEGSRTAEAENNDMEVLAMKDETSMLAEFIVRENGGKFMYNLGEVARILGQGRNDITYLLHQEGIMVKKVGQEKLANAYQIAEFMVKNRIAPIDKTSKGIVARGHAHASAGIAVS